MTRQRNIGTDAIKGELLHFTVRGQDYWGTGVVRTKHEGGDITITGKVLGAKTGDTVQCEGFWSDSERYGKQFKVTNCEVVLPSDASGVVAWLASHLPQVSRRRAEQLVELHGIEGVWRVLDGGDVAALCELDGITRPRAAEILDAYRANRGERDRVVRLKSYGLTDAQLARVLDKWGDEAEQMLQRDPYALMDAVDGFGWKRADQVAQRMGLALDAPPRLAAALMHAMREAAAAGHCYVASGKLVALVASKLLSGNATDAQVYEQLTSLVKAERLVPHGVNVYLPRLAEAESVMAEMFAARAGEKASHAA